MLFKELKEEQQQQKQQQQQEQQQQQQQQQPLIQKDSESNPFMESPESPTPSSQMEDPQTITSNPGLFSDTEAETSHPEDSDMSQPKSQEEDMDISTNPPPGLETTPPKADSTLGKRPIHSSLERQEVGRPRSSRGRSKKQNMQDRSKDQRTLDK